MCLVKILDKHLSHTSEISYILKKNMQSHIVFIFVFTLFCFSHDLSGSEVKLAVNGAIPTTIRLTGRIVNGTNAAWKQFPHQVSLSRSYSLNHFCGGSIISTKMVLTAAHCMFLHDEEIHPWTITVIAGILKLNSRTSTRQERGVEKINIHPQFDIFTLHNDVAVLQLSIPFTFTPEVRNIPLTGNALVPNTICQVSGWGYRAFNIPVISNDLMYVDLPVRSIEECRNLLKNISNLPPGMFCAGYMEGGRDACQGDSGGGMVCNGILSGIVSGGKGCAFPGLPGVYGDIYYYLSWITKNEAIVIHRHNNSANYTGRNNGEQQIAILTFTLFLTLLSIIF